MKIFQTVFNKTLFLFYIAFYGMLIASESLAYNERFRSADDNPKRLSEIEQYEHDALEWWNGRYFTGEWNGYRKKAEDRGILLTGSVVFAVLGNPSGGTSQGVAQNSSFGVNLAVDFGKLFKEKTLDGTHFFTNVIQRGGGNLSQSHINNRFTVSQSYGGQNFRVNEFYIQQNIHDKDFWFKFGRLDTGTDFLTSPLYCTFVNNAFCGNPVGVFFNVPFSAYPNSQWGVLFATQPVEQFVAKFGVYNTNEQASQMQHHGLDLSFQADQGAQLIGSITYLLNQGENDTGYTGTYTAGMMYYTGVNKNPGSYAGGSTYNGPFDRRDVGYFVELEQMLFRNGGKGSTEWLKAFAAAEFFNHWTTDYMPFFFNSGLVYQGLLPKRPLDQIALGIAVGQFGFNSINNAGATFRAETVIELTYKIQVNHWWYLQPDVQVVIHPFGGSADLAGVNKAPPSAWIVGFETGVDF